MKVMIARMNHETNTFSPVPTPLSAFGNDGPTYDRAAYDENHGKRTAMSAFIDSPRRGRHAGHARVRHRVPQRPRPRPGLS